MSISTVSRVFSHPERLSPATVRHVREVAQRLRFHPNATARALITGVAANVGLVVPDITNPYVTRLLKAAQMQSRSAGVGLLVADTDDNAQIERHVAEQLARQSRGLILCGPRMSALHIRQVAAVVPVVVVNRIVTGVPSVYTDSEPALQRVVDDLYDLGHHKVAYLPGPAGSWANRQRQRAVIDRAAHHGMLVTTLASASTFEEGIAASRGAVASGVTAVVAFDDVLASGLIEGLRRAGASVPGDMSVVGHDDVLAALIQPGLTTVAGHSDRVGRLAVERLLDPLDGQETPESIAICADVVTRSSTAVAPAP